MGEGDLMRTARDVIRSLNRYVSLALPDWEVREAAEEGTVERPFAQVKATSPQAGPTDDVRVASVNQSFTIYAYPVPDMTHVLAGRDAAAEVEDALWSLFAQGLDEGRPYLVPLYDHDETPWNVSSDQRRSVDFARVQDLNVSIQQAPDDEHLFTVLVEVRLWWRRNAAVPSVAKRITETKRPRINAP